MRTVRLDRLQYPDAGGQVVFGNVHARIVGARWIRGCARVCSTRHAEVLHPVDLAAFPAHAHGNTDLLEPRVHDVRAMPRTCEPPRDDFLGGLRPQGDVLAGEARVVTGAPHPVPGLAAVAAAMLEELLA